MDFLDKYVHPFMGCITIFDGIYGILSSPHSTISLLLIGIGVTLVLVSLMLWNPVPEEVFIATALQLLVLWCALVFEVAKKPQEVPDTPNRMPWILFWMVVVMASSFIAASPFLGLFFLAKRIFFKKINEVVSLNE